VRAALQDQFGEDNLAPPPPPEEEEPANVELDDDDEKKPVLGAGPSKRRRTDEGADEGADDVKVAGPAPAPAEPQEPPRTELYKVQVKHDETRAVCALFRDDGDTTSYRFSLDVASQDDALRQRLLRLLTRVIDASTPLDTEARLRRTRPGPAAAL